MKVIHTSSSWVLALQARGGSDAASRLGCVDIANRHAVELTAYAAKEKGIVRVERLKIIRSS